MDPHVQGALETPGCSRPGFGLPRAGPYPGLLLHLEHYSLMLLGYGQSRRVHLLIDHFSFPCLKSEQSFSRVTHSVRTETGKEMGLRVFKCTSVLHVKGALAPSYPPPRPRVTEADSSLTEPTDRPTNAFFNGTWERTSGGKPMCICIFKDEAFTAA